MAPETRGAAFISAVSLPRGAAVEPFSKAPAGWDSRNRRNRHPVRRTVSSGEIEAYDIVIYGATGFTGTHVAESWRSCHTANEQYYGRLQESPESKDNESALEGNREGHFLSPLLADLSAS